MHGVEAGKFFLSSSLHHLTKAMSEEAEASAASAGFGKGQDVAVKKAEVLANLVLSAPERFASGDQHVVQGSLDAMKAILDFGESVT